MHCSHGIPKEASDNRSCRTGFTLLEVLIVLAILGVIAAMVVPNILGQQQRASIEATEGSIHGFEESLKLYAVSHDGLFPEGDQNTVVNQLMQPEELNGTTIEPVLDKVPKDAWGEVLYYEYPSSKTTNSKPAIWSSGPNRKDDQGSGDDITNWGEADL